MWRNWILLGLATLALLCAVTPVHAKFYQHKESDVDPRVFRIDEQKYMGVKLDLDTALIDEEGQTRSFKEYVGKPTILIWSYFTCDGSCAAVNAELVNLLEKAKVGTVSGDVTVLTISFDAADTVETLKAFRTKLALPPSLSKGWRFALFKNPEQIKSITGSTGFKFFWAPQDQIFYHPNVFIFLTPDGRISRYLYALVNSPKDVSLALLEAKQGNFRINETLDLAISLCYSYNYKEGRYTVNIPLFVGVGSLMLGVSTLIGSVFFYRLRKNKGGMAK
ncbi:MAG: SCO family protein [Magnetococcales bacterium]|nr:SCO family protein [Magnetococcales bacterium]